MSAVPLIALGSTIVLAALIDVFLTVLHGRAGAGLIAPRMNAWLWRGVRAIAVRMPRGGDRLLALTGPAFLVVTAALWWVMLWFGFALIAWPMLGEWLRASDGPTPTDFPAALYYSGYSLTTLGTGDIVPKTDLARILMILQAATGFTVITLTLTYILSVYTALTRQNTYAQTLHHFSGGSGRPVDLLANLLAGGSTDAIEARLETIGRGALDLLESHHAYPVLHYFRMADARYALARIVLLVLEPLTLLRSGAVVGPDRLHHTSTFALAWGAGLDLVRQTAHTLPSGLLQPVPRAGEDTLHARLQHARARGLSVRDDDDVQARHRALHAQWWPRARGFAQAMAYDWRRIDPPA